MSLHAPRLLTRPGPGLGRWPALLALVALAATLPLGACNLTSMAAGQTVKIIAAGKPSVDAQTDLVVARVSIESNLGMMEGLEETRPDDEALHALMAEAYTGYAFGFVEDDLDALADGDPERELVADRAAALYLRGRAHAFRKLSLSRGVPDLAAASDNAFDVALTELGKADAPTLFWGANAWGSLIQLRQDDPMMIMEMPRVEAMMRRVLELDETYFDGGAHLFFALLELSVPAALSDGTAAAAEHFDRAIAIAEGKNLMLNALRARFLHVATRDRAAFVSELKMVLDADPELSTRHNLFNALAKRRARRWLARVDRLFPAPGA